MQSDVQSPGERQSKGRRALILRRHALISLFILVVISPQARAKNIAHYGDGLIINIPAPIAEVSEAVQDVAGNGIIRGTREYAKDEYVSGAFAASSTPLFPPSKEPGKVFYKIRKAVLNPWNFKDSADVGTIAVRYVLQPQGENNSILRIDALYVEDFRRTVHQSNGSVESSEYKDIQDHLSQMELIKKETADAEKEKAEHIAKKEFDLNNGTELLSTPPSSSLESSSRPDALADRSSSAKLAEPIDPNETPEQRLARLRRDVERLVKKPGAPLKSAPFHTARTLKTLDPGTEVLIVVLTPYWLGVETHDGEHGWIRRDELEPLP